MNNELNASEIIDKLQQQVADLEAELSEFRDERNWTRSYNYQGELINEFALYIPRLDSW